MQFYSLRAMRFLLLLLLLAVTVARPLAAQQIELVIRDHTVSVNGEVIAEKDLPSGLDLDGISLMYKFFKSPKDQGEVIRIKDGWYEITADGLARANAAQANIFWFRNDSSRAEDFVRGIHEVRLLTQHYEAEQMKAMEELVRHMHQTRRSLKPLRSQVTVRLAPPMADDAVRVMAAAEAQLEEAAEVLETVPRAGLMRYLSEVQEGDSGLYGLLVEEWAREREAMRLATEIRRLARGRDRDRKMVELRKQLAAIFELKQENRRREIQQLEGKLHGLQERLKEREAVRTVIVERRLRDLLDADF